FIFARSPNWNCLRCWSTTSPRIPEVHFNDSYSMPWRRSKVHMPPFRFSTNIDIFSAPIASALLTTTPFAIELMNDTPFFRKQGADVRFLYGSRVIEQSVEDRLHVCEFDDVYAKDLIVQN